MILNSFCNKILLIFLLIWNFIIARRESDDSKKAPQEKKKNVSETINEVIPNLKPPTWALLEPDLSSILVRDRPVWPAD